MEEPDWSKARNGLLPIHCHFDHEDRYRSLAQHHLSNLACRQFERRQDLGGNLLKVDGSGLGPLVIEDSQRNHHG